ncbi:hypothetical protein GE061_019057 [Apolygus lucorum]|uniref:RING-type domain-containing protein n=1 Tax=Apolygus lucorum TaxID=248454 RepID=A0A6A4JS83_APOLU|nr:hypothetical protein GE061_019057 [Apolygus lucorum]
MWGFSWLFRIPFRQTKDKAQPETSSSLKRKEPDTKEPGSETPNKKPKLDACPICLEEMQEDKSATPCGHTFCTPCLTESYKYSKKCPLCRQPAKDTSESGSGEANEEEHEEGEEEEEGEEGGGGDADEDDEEWLPGSDDEGDESEQENRRSRRSLRRRQVNPS